MRRRAICDAAAHEARVGRIRRTRFVRALSRRLGVLICVGVDAALASVQTASVRPGLTLVFAPLPSAPLPPAAHPLLPLLRARVR